MLTLLTGVDFSRFGKASLDGTREEVGLTFSFLTWTAGVEDEDDEDDELLASMAVLGALAEFSKCREFKFAAPPFSSLIARSVLGDFVKLFTVFAVAKVSFLGRSIGVLVFRENS